MLNSSFQRFISEWQLPSVLLVRIGFPFMVGLYDVKPKLTTSSKSVSSQGKVTALGVSIPNALFTATHSCLRYFTYRSLVIGICTALFKSKIPLLQDAAIEAESSERHTDFSVRQALGLIGVPPSIAGALTSARRTTADDLYRFKLEAQNNSGFSHVLSSHLQRNLLVSTISTLHTYLMMKITLNGINRLRNRENSAFKDYIFDVQAETIGIPTRTWQLQSVIGSNFCQAIGAAFGAAVASLIAPSSSVSVGESQQQQQQQQQQTTSLMLLGGDFFGGVIGMTIFRALFIKYRDVEFYAKSEEHFYQSAMGELMGYAAASK